MEVKLLPVLSTIMFFAFIGGDCIYADQTPLLNQILVVMQALSFLVTIIWWVKKKVFSKFDVWLFAFFSILLIVTLVREGYVYSLLTRWMRIFGCVFLAEILIKQNKAYLFSSLSIVYSALVYLGCVCLLLYPDGMFYVRINNYVTLPYSILGNGNSYGIVLIPAIVINSIYASTCGRKYTINLVLLMLCSAIILLKVWSATSIVSFALLLGYYFFVYKTRFASYVTSKRLLAIYILFFLGIVAFQIQSSFSFLIEDVLKKGFTFSSRTVIWDLALVKIKNSFLLGYGEVFHGLYIDVFGGRNAHNIILHILLQGGIIAFGIFFSLLYIVLSRLNKNKKFHLSNWLSVSIFVMFVLMTTEVYSLLSLFLMFLFAFYIEKFRYNRSFNICVWA